MHVHKHSYSNTDTYAHAHIHAYIPQGNTIADTGLRITIIEWSKVQIIHTETGVGITNGVKFTHLDERNHKYDMQRVEAKMTDMMPACAAKWGSRYVCMYVCMHGFELCLN